MVYVFLSAYVFLFLLSCKLLIVTAFCICIYIIKGNNVHSVHISSYLCSSLFSMWPEPCFSDSSSYPIFRSKAESERKKVTDNSNLYSLHREG